MDYRLTFVVCFVIIALVAASPGSRDRRDVMESMKGAWNDMVKTLSDAGDAVVHVFRPTEKSVIDKVADGVKGLGQ